MVWKRQILKVSYRQNKISDFVNGDNVENDFRILDPLAKSYSNSVLQNDFKSQTCFNKALWYKADGLFYLMMIFVSLILGIALCLEMVKDKQVKKISIITSGRKKCEINLDDYFHKADLMVE